METETLWYVSVWVPTTAEQRAQNPHLKQRMMKTAGMLPAVNLTDASTQVLKLGLKYPVAELRDSGEKLLAP